MKSWDRAWLERTHARQVMLAFRGVEAQHVVSTMRLVDTMQEQDILEALLELSKPGLPQAKTPKHYLLATPFRYRPQHSSRFRRAGTQGLWYGAEHLRAACAEVAYWRYRFILDSVPLLDSELLTEHTFFQARVQGIAIDLTTAPWDTTKAVWTHGSDYSAPQALADAARERGVQWICYESVREPGNRCAAVLDVEALEMAAPDSHHQTWHCRATRNFVMMARGDQKFIWNF